MRYTQTRLSKATLKIQDAISKRFSCKEPLRRARLHKYRLEDHWQSWSHFRLWFLTSGAQEPDKWFDRVSQRKRASDQRFWEWDDTWNSQHTHGMESSYGPVTPAPSHAWVPLTTWATQFQHKLQHDLRWPQSTHHGRVSWLLHSLAASGREACDSAATSQFLWVCLAARLVAVQHHLGVHTPLFQGGGWM